MKQMKIIPHHFFPRGHGNEFSDLTGSLPCLDFPISAHGQNL